MLPNLEVQHTVQWKSCSVREYVLHCSLVKCSLVLTTEQHELMVGGIKGLAHVCSTSTRSATASASIRATHLEIHHQQVIWWWASPTSCLLICSLFVCRGISTSDLEHVNLAVGRLLIDDKMFRKRKLQSLFFLSFIVWLLCVPRCFRYNFNADVNNDIKLTVTPGANHTMLTLSCFV